MQDLETYPIALVELFDLNTARHQAREALQLGRRVVVTVTQRGERCHAVTAVPMSDGSVHLISVSERASGKRPNIRTAVEDGFGVIAGLFRPAGTPEIVPIRRRRPRA